MQVLIGRETEKSILLQKLQSKQPELVAVYGRRRVGKTYLIKSVYHTHMVFSCVGQYQSGTITQLANFHQQLQHWFPRRKHEVPETWQQAFQQLTTQLRLLKTKKKKVVFIDELPWMDSHKSGFLAAFGYFWNTVAANMPDLLVIVCGSATSWIIEKIVNDKGGLHNRITQRIRLLPFTVKETEQFLLSKNIRYSRYDILQLYMTVGGVPAYLNELTRGKSVAQNIQKICFAKDGLLAGEFNNLYAALFRFPDRHIQIVRTLAAKNKGLTRNELLATGKLLSGGTLTKTLQELAESGFIEKTYPLDNKEKDSLYRLTDEFTLFYFRFMQQKAASSWVTRQNTPSYTTWCGYAFENICLKHISAIKKTLQIGAVYSNERSWVYKGSTGKQGVQIDLLIDRDDHIINLCEIKYYNKTFTIDKKYAQVLEQKKKVFQQQSKTPNTILLTFITSYGLTDNAYKQQWVDNEMTMEALFQ